MFSVLFVDDDQEILDLFAMYLEKSKKIRVIKEKSAKNALALLKKRHIDAVVSDYRMPEMDGITLLKHIRDISRSLPFFLFTGKGDENVAMEAMNLGANFYTKKGGSPRETFRDLEERILSAIHLVSDEVALKKRTNLFDCITEESPLAIAAFDAHLHCMFANKKFQATFQDRKKIIGTLIQEFFPDSPKSKDSLLHWIRESGEKDLYSIHNDGGFRWIFRLIEKPEEDLFIATYGIPAISQPE